MKSAEQLETSTKASLCSERHPATCSSSDAPCSHQRPIKICFVGLYCYSLINPSTSYYFGGFEVRAWTFASALARDKRYQVSFVVRDHGQLRVEKYRNVMVYTHPDFIDSEVNIPVSNCGAFLSSLHLPSWQSTKRSVVAFVGQKSPFLPADETTVDKGMTGDLCAHKNTHWDDAVCFIAAALNLTQQVLRVFLDEGIRSGIRRTIRWLLWRYYDARSQLASWFRNMQKKMRQVFCFATNVIAIAIPDRWTCGKITSQATHHSAMPPLSAAARQLYKRIGADIYCVFGVHNLAAEVAVYCEEAHVRFFLFSGSAMDFSETYRLHSSERNRYGDVSYYCHYAITHAYILIVQAESHALLLEQRFERKGNVIRNPVEIATLFAETPYAERTIVLWVGRIGDGIKQPELFIQLARAIPEHDFKMIIGRTIPEERAKCLKNAPDNLQVIENVPFDQVEEHYAAAAVLVNTSKFEGFPNSFLQAGKYGVPLLSLNVDTDGFIEKHSCGFFLKGDTERLKVTLRMLLDDKKTANEYSSNIRSYVQQYHRKEDRVAELDRLCHASLLQSESGQITEDVNQNRHIKVCFLNLYGYSLFNMETQYAFGGSEVRSWLLCTGLAQRFGYDVTCIVYNHGQNVKERYGNVAVCPHGFYKSDEMPIRKANPASPDRNQCINRDVTGTAPSTSDETYDLMNADIYCSFGVSNVSAGLASYCQANGKKFILFSGWDGDFAPEYRPGSTGRNIYGAENDRCYAAIALADRIVVQSQYQAAICRERFGKTPIIMTNPIDMSYVQVPSRKNRETVLWIGKSDWRKQPELFLELARRFPQTKFCMIMSLALPDRHASILNACPPNVEILEYVPYREIEKYFAKAFVFISTSKSEGFPNAFLQAAKYGVPILTLHVDPDGFIAKNDCGVCAEGDFEKLAYVLHLMINDDISAKHYCENILQYVKANHPLEDKVSELEEIIHDIL